MQSKQAHIDAGSSWLWNRHAFTLPRFVSRHPGLGSLPASLRAKLLLLLNIDPQRRMVELSELAGLIEKTARSILVCSCGQAAFAGADCSKCGQSITALRTVTKSSPVGLAPLSARDPQPLDWVSGSESQYQPQQSAQTRRTATHAAITNVVPAAPRSNPKTALVLAASAGIVLILLLLAVLLVAGR